MERAAGQPQKKGNKRGASYAYHVKEMRHQEMQIGEKAQESYEHFVAAWRARPPSGNKCAAASPWQGLHGLPWE